MTRVYVVQAPASLTPCTSSCAPCPCSSVHACMHAVCVVYVALHRSISPELRQQAAALHKYLSHNPSQHRSDQRMSLDELTEALATGRAPGTLWADDVCQTSYVSRNTGCCACDCVCVCMCACRACQGSTPTFGRSPAWLRRTTQRYTRVRRYRYTGALDAFALLARGHMGHRHSSCCGQANTHV